jgi:hypothetical protein
VARRAKGEGSIFKSESDGRWKALFWIDSDTRIGKSAKTQKEVRDWLIEQQDKKRKGLIVAKPN